MAEYTVKWEEVENELVEIAAELTALGGHDTGLVHQSGNCIKFIIAL
jgi:acyl-CoA synthetase (AMP-forming)/AMP-acid ligase II